MDRVVCIPGLDEAAATVTGGRRARSYAESIGADRRCGSRVSRRNRTQGIGGRVGEGERRTDAGRPRTERGGGEPKGEVGSGPYKARRRRINLARKQAELGVGMTIREARVREDAAGFGRRATIRPRASADDSGDMEGGRCEVKGERRGVMGPGVPGHRGRARWLAPPR